MKKEKCVVVNKPIDKNIKPYYIIFENKNMTIEYFNKLEVNIAAKYLYDLSNEYDQKEFIKDWPLFLMANL